MEERAASLNTRGLFLKLRNSKQEMYLFFCMVSLYTVVKFPLPKVSSTTLLKYQPGKLVIIAVTATMTASNLLGRMDLSP